MSAAWLPFDVECPHFLILSDPLQTIPYQCRLFKCEVKFPITRALFAFNGQKKSESEKNVMGREGNEIYLNVPFIS